MRSRSRRLQIRILENGLPIAVDEKAAEVNTEHMPIERLILQARNSIFDEELHHELNREARNLVNQGVRCVNDAITLPCEAEKQIEIDLVPLGDKDLAISQTDASSASRETPQGDDIILKSIAISLRILLSHAHHQILAQRSHPPPPIRGTKPPRPIYPILKPILEILRHRSDVQTTRTFLTNLNKHLSAATLNFDIEESPISPNLTNLPFLAASENTSATEALVKSLITPLHTSTIIHLPSDLTTVKLELHTSFDPPTVGTVYQATILSSPPTSSLPSLPQSMHFSSPSALEDHILHLMKLDIISFISTNLAAESGWTTISSHDGQLFRRDRERRISQTFTIFVEKELVSLECRTVGGGTDHLRTHRWVGGNEGRNEERGLLNVIEEALKEK